MKLLVVTPEPVDAKLLRATLGEEVQGAEVLVVSPATNQSKVAFWVSDSDDAIEEAELAQEETVERLEEEGVDAAGDTGETPTASSSSATPTSTTARTSATPTSASLSRTLRSRASRGDRLGADEPLERADQLPERLQAQ